MRREGFEFAVSPPQVLRREGPSGELLEPFEEVVLEVEEDATGSVIESLTARGAELREVLPTQVFTLDPILPPRQPCQFLCFGGSVLTGSTMESGMVG